MKTVTENEEQIVDQAYNEWRTAAQAWRDAQKSGENWNTVSILESKMILSENRYHSLVDSAYGKHQPHWQ